MVVRAEKNALMKYALASLAFWCFLTGLSFTAGAGSPGSRANIRNEQPMAELTALFERQLFQPRDKKLQDLTYFWFQPIPPYPEGLKFPLVLVLHGGSGNSYASRFLVKPEMQRAYPAFIVVPVLPERKLWAGSHPAAAKGEGIHDAVALIRDIVTRYPVDIRRIYVIGCSDGGTGTFGAVTYYPDLFAGAIAISGAWNPENAPKMTKVPIAAMHGAADTIISPNSARDTMGLIQQYGGQAFYNELPGQGHNCAAEHYYAPSIWSWLFSQKKSAPQ